MDENDLHVANEGVLAKDVSDGEHMVTEEDSDWVDVKRGGDDGEWDNDDDSFVF